MKISTLNKILTGVLLATLTACIVATSLVFLHQKNVYVKTEYRAVEVPVQVWHTEKAEAFDIWLPNGKVISSKDIKIEASEYNYKRYTLYY